MRLWTLEAGRSELKTSVRQLVTTFCRISTHAMVVVVVILVFVTRCRTKEC